MEVDDNRKRRQGYDVVNTEEETLVRREVVVDGETRLTFERFRYSRLYIRTVALDNNANSIG